MTARHFRCNGANAFQRWIRGDAPKAARPTTECCNGANAFQRWIQGEIHVIVNVNIMLQWGQRLSALDTALRQGEREDQGPAAMGPTPFSVGYGGRQPHTVRQKGAAMGPTPFSVGYSDMTLRVSMANNAAMGPTPFSVGYLLRRDGMGATERAAMGPTPFSVGYVEKGTGTGDAAELLQWGQRLSALDTVAAGEGVNAIGGLQWGQRLSALDTRPASPANGADEPSCNGANAFQRWIQCFRRAFRSL